jgi:DNA-directed RNA polymerase subunit alpha
VKIDGVEHEFSAMDGVKEDVIMILLNLRRIRLALHSDEPITITLKKSGIGMVTAGDISAPSQVEILNPEQPICEITGKGTKLEMELRIEKGLGYVPREVHMKDKMEIGAIAMDAVFTPIRRANYEVENMRVGDRTDYNRLRITLETDGTYSAREALEKSIEIMIHQLKAVIGFQEEHTHPASAPAAPVAEVKKEEPNQEILKTRIETLDLTSRTLQALETASIRTIGGLVRKKKDDILALDGIGPKGLEEIVEMLLRHNLHLEQ